MIGALIGLAILVVAALGWLSYAAAGAAGLVVLATVLLGLGALIARVRLQPPQEPEPSAGPILRTRADTAFPSYREITSMLSWSSTSRYHFDRVVHPMLWELVVEMSAARHGDAASRDIASLRAHIGAQLWPLVDPDSPEWTDRSGERADGPDIPTLTALVDRIERI